MGIPVLVMGESGSGKSRSLKNFAANEVGVFNVAGKPLPFRNELKTLNVNKFAKAKGRNRYDVIKSTMKAAKAKALIIDDSQFLMAFDSFDKANEVGYKKFTDMAVSFEQLVEFIINELEDDVIVYFLHHTEIINDTGKVKAKTVGKMLDNQLTLEGLFSIVILCTINDGVHQFITQTDGMSTAKSPEEMLPLTMENDLKAVDTAIRDYYRLSEVNENEEC